mmetsp:Transcript_13895/g.33550  ORF Transcript_13895/g.33550 Transcript_13895/m.33550 type:complete len:348 (+) Transcript_13895:2246-3289(+)
MRPLDTAAECVVGLAELLQLHDLRSSLGPRMHAGNRSRPVSGQLGYHVHCMRYRMEYTSLWAQAWSFGDRPARGRRRWQSLLTWLSRDIRSWPAARGIEIHSASRACRAGLAADKHPRHAAGAPALWAGSSGTGLTQIEVTGTAASHSLADRHRLAAGAASPPRLLNQEIPKLVALRTKSGLGHAGLAQIVVARSACHHGCTGRLDRPAEAAGVAELVSPNHSKTVPGAALCQRTAANGPRGAADQTCGTPRRRLAARGRRGRAFAQVAGQRRRCCLADAGAAGYTREARRRRFSCNASGAAGGLQHGNLWPPGFAERSRRHPRPRSWRRTERRPRWPWRAAYFLKR